MRLATFCAAFLSSGLFLFMSCSSIPNPLEEREPWEHALAQAKRAAQREAEHVVRAAKLRSDLKSASTLDNMSRYIGASSIEAIRWHKRKMRWLAEARKKGFTGENDEADPEWYKKWKQKMGYAD
ncbi:MAG: hypothetical protein OXT69_14425 [Candidatus Poribacteria bacterium]|nr:hypothetical protein [Candidatus Poribacteria bacterium]